MNTFENQGMRRGRVQRNLFVAWLCSLLLATAANAAGNDRLYDVTVNAGSQTAAFEDAMRIVLQRATGRRDAAADPALGGLLSDPRRFVKVVRPSAGGTLVSFDGAALERAIVAAGRAVWSGPRPRTIIALRSTNIDSAAQAELAAVALARGVSIQIVSAASLGLPNASIERDQALAAAQRAGGDALLVGERFENDGSGLYRWALQTSTSASQSSGGLQAGLQDAVDGYVRAAEAVQSLPEVETLVAFLDVQSLRDFALVTETLGGLPGLKRVLLREVAPQAAMFRLVARGGADALLASLGSSGRFESVPASGGAVLAFRARR